MADEFQFYGKARTVGKCGDWLSFYVDLGTAFGTFSKKQQDFGENRKHSPKRCDG
jgi:hypothetical protein